MKRWRNRRKQVNAASNQNHSSSDENENDILESHVPKAAEREIPSDNDMYSVSDETGSVGAEGRDEIGVDIDIDNNGGGAAPFIPPDLNIVSNSSTSSSEFDSDCLDEEGDSVLCEKLQ